MPVERGPWDDFAGEDDAPWADFAPDFGNVKASSASSEAALGTTSNPFKGAAARALDVLGSGVRGVATLGERIGDTLETALPLSGLTPEQIAGERQLAPLFGAADYLSQKAKEVGYVPRVSGTQAWDALTTMPGSLGEVGTRAKDLGAFAIDSAVASAPDMAAALGAPIPYMLGRTSEIGEQRAVNDQRTDGATLGDMLAASPAAVIEVLGERLGAKYIPGLGGKQLAGGLGARVAKQVGIQAGTEGVQGGASYLGETLGTETGMTPEGLAQASVLEALGGLGVAAPVAAVEVAANYLPAKTQAPNAPRETPNVEITGGVPATPADIQNDAAIVEAFRAKQALGVPAEPVDDIDAAIDAALLRNVPADEAPAPVLDVGALERAGVTLDDAIAPDVLAALNEALGTPDPDAAWRRPESAVSPLGAPPSVETAAPQTLPPLGDANGRDQEVAGPAPQRPGLAALGSLGSPADVAGVRPDPAAGGAVEAAGLPATAGQRADSDAAAGAQADGVNGPRPPRYSALDMRQEIGWSQRGGEMVRAARDPSELNEDERNGIVPIPPGPVIGRTRWTGWPNPQGEESTFWKNRPDKNLSEKAAQAAMDKFERGEPLRPIEQRFIDHAQAVAQDYEQAAQFMEDVERGYSEVERQRGFEDIRAQHDIEVLEADQSEAMSLYELAHRAAERGVDDIDLAQASNESPQAYAARLWKLTQEPDNGADTRATAEDRASGDQGREGGQASVPQGFGLAAQTQPAATQEVARPSAGLFGAPTAKDFVEAAKRDKDASRDGKTGTGRTDMLAGDGNLFAGPAPEQEALESVEDTGFYSAALRAVETAKGLPKRGTYGDWRGWLDGAVRRGDMKQSERDWLGLDAYLSGRDTTTRQELADFIRANEVKVEEVTLAGPSENMPVPPELEAFLDEEGFDAEDIDGPSGWLSVAQRARGLAGQYAGEDDADGAARMRNVAAAAETMAGGGAGVAKFTEYQLPGGENYRELLLTLPTERAGLDSEAARHYEAFVRRGGEPEWADLPQSRRDQIRETMPSQASPKLAGKEFRSSHFDQPNILAHVRFNERVDSEGRRVLFLEEIQSDWHQAGRKKGYQKSGPEFVIVTPSHTYRFGHTTREEAQAHLETLAPRLQAVSRIEESLNPTREGVPDAPFKATDEWAMLAFKRMVRHAAENGFDRIAWTTGTQQAERYDLSKQVQSIEYMDTGRLLVMSTSGGVIHNDIVTDDKLPDIIGKEVADRLLAETPRNRPGLPSLTSKSRLVSGDGLKVGGEGMRGFYDKILPSAVNKWAKKFGAKVGEASVATMSDLSKETEAERAERYRAISAGAPAESGRAKSVPVHAIDLTPAMRDAALQGMPLFQQEAQDVDPADLTPAQRASFDRQSIDRKGLREKLSREQGDADADANGLRAAVNRALGTSGNKVVYLRNKDGLPENVRGPQERAAAQRGANMRTAGLFHPATGTVYLFTDVVKTPQMAAFTASHEIAGHQGLRALLGDRLNNVLDLAEQNPTVKAVAASMTNQRNLRPDQRYLAIEEALADLAAAVRTKNFQRITDKHGVEVPKAMQSRLRAMIDNIVARIKALFGKQGVAFTDAQVLNLLENAWQAAQGNRASMSVIGADGALEQVVFHGTPHTVDKFSLQKIGTGEGNAAYGWGLYFAGQKEIAEHYRKTLSGRNVTSGSDSMAMVEIGGKNLLAAYPIEYDPDIIAFAKAKDNFGAWVYADKVRAKWAALAVDKDYPHQKYAAEKAEAWKGLSAALEGDAKISTKENGNLYRVDVPEDSDLLDWDKPLSKQPEKVRRALLDFFGESTREWLLSANPSGRDIYQQVGEYVGGGPTEASETLLRAGIPGLRYVDGGNRSPDRTDAQLVAALEKYPDDREAALNMAMRGVYNTPKEKAKIREAYAARMQKLEKRHNYVIWDESAIGTPSSALESTEDQTQSEAFKRWAGEDAEFVPADEGDAAWDRTFKDGKPVVLEGFHGTGASFDVFNNGNAPASSGKNRAGAAWFSNDPSVANVFAGHQDGTQLTRDIKLGNAQVYRVFVKMRNPYIDTKGEYAKFGGLDRAGIAELEADGYDGVIWPNAPYDLPDDGDAYRKNDKGQYYGEQVPYPHQYAVWNPTQVKSATANSGAFDPTSDSILESVEYTPEQEAALTKAGMPVDRRSTLQRAKAKLAEEWSKVREAARDSDALKLAVFDRFHGLRMAEAQLGLTDPALSPYLAARMSVAQAQHVEATMLYGAPKWDNGVVTIDDSTVGLLDALKPVEGKIDAWLGWMVGRRAKLLKSQGRENNLSDADITALLSLADGNEAAFKEAAAGYLKIKNAILDFAQEAGVIDPVGRAAWDHAEYIPFYRAENEGTIGPGTRKGLAGQNAGIRTLKGGENALADPLANIVRNFAKLIDAGTKNRAVLLAVDQLGAKFFQPAKREMTPATIPLDQVKKHLRDQGVPEATLQGMPPSALKGVQRMLSIIPPTGENVVRVMRDGKAEYYEVADPLVLRSLTAFKQPNRSLAVKPLIWFKRLLTTGVTTTAEFVGANFIRDSGSAWVMSDDRFTPGWDSLKGVANTLRNDQTAKDMMMAGGTFLGGNFYDGNPDAAAAALRRALRQKGMANKDIEGFMGTVARSPLVLWDKWMQLSGAIENANRRAVFDAAIKAGRSRAEAAFMARDLMDFNMQGDAAFIQFFSDVLPFFNARLQGMYKLGRRAGTKEGRKAILLRGGVITLASVALYAWNVMAYGDAWDELEEWDKDAYWHIAPGTPFHTRIPKPFEIGLVFATAPERGLEAIRRAATGEGDTPSATWDALVRAITGTLAINPIPQAFLPLAEQWANKRFFTGRAIEGMGDDKLLPEDRSSWFTSDTAKALGRMSGLSPKRLEHLWNGYTAGLGGYVLDTADAFTRWVQDAPERAELAPKDFPVVGRFYRGGTPGNSKYVEQFYRRFEKAEHVEQSIKEAILKGEGDRAAKLEAENADLLGERLQSKRAKAGFMFENVKALRKVRDQMGKLRENAETVALSRTASPEQKRDALDELTRQRNKLAREAVKQ